MLYYQPVRLLPSCAFIAHLFGALPLPFFLLYITPKRSNIYSAIGSVAVRSLNVSYYNTLGQKARITADRSGQYTYFYIPTGHLIVFSTVWKP